MKFYIALTITFIALISNLEGGCGGCQIKNNTDATKKPSNFITKVPLNNKLEGFVISSCNKCNLGRKDDKKCSVGILIDDKAYDVKGYKENHQKSHEVDGICNAFRVAYVAGNLYNKTLYADSFKMITAPE